MLQHGPGAGSQRVAEPGFQQPLVFVLAASLAAQPFPGVLAGRAVVVGVEDVGVVLRVVGLAGHHDAAQDAGLGEVLAGAVLLLPAVALVRRAGRVQADGDHVRVGGPGGVRLVVGGVGGVDGLVVHLGPRLRRVGRRAAQGFPPRSGVLGHPASQHQVVGDGFAVRVGRLLLGRPARGARLHPLCAPGAEPYPIFRPGGHAPTHPHRPSSPLLPALLLPLPLQQTGVHLLLDLEEAAVPLRRLVVRLQPAEALVQRGARVGHTAAGGRRDLRVRHRRVQRRAPVSPAPEQRRTRDVQEGGGLAPLPETAALLGGGESGGGGGRRGGGGGPGEEVFRGVAHGRPDAQRFVTHGLLLWERKGRRLDILCFRTVPVGEEGETVRHTVLQDGACGRGGGDG